MRPLAVLAIALMAASGGSASAASCRDGKGKFVTCPPAAPVAAARCRDGKGKFIKCAAATAAPK